MARYLQNKDLFKKYKVLPEFDVRTHDVPRDKAGNINPTFDDLYIPCSGGAKIYHYGQREMVAYIPSVKRGNKLLRQLKGIAYNIEITDAEVLFRFKIDHLDRVADALKARQNRISRVDGEYIVHSPFASINLPRAEIPHIAPEKMQEYKAILKQIGDGDYLIIGKLTRRYMTEIMAKKLNVDDINAEMKRQKLSRYRKEFIYANGCWDDYLEFLKKEIGKK